MKVTEHLAKAQHLLISFEIIPPKRGASLETLDGVVAELAQFHPPFIDVTSRAAEPLSHEIGTTDKRMRKSPGTLGICVLIKHKYGIDAVPHVLCQGFTREETEDFLLELSYCGVENILALRGDELGYEKTLRDGKTRNASACELVHQIQDLKRGRYLHEQGRALDFCVGVAGYPEKHLKAVDLATDIYYTKQKADAGAEYIVTQMFFDNSTFFGYVQKCREAGITLPIIPGIKILTRKEQAGVLEKTFHCRIPEELSNSLGKAREKGEVEHIGREWAVRQVKELSAYGVPAVHFYVMLNAAPVSTVMEGLKEEGVVRY